MRYRYQAAVINLAKDAVVSSKTSMPTRPGSIEEADGWMGLEGSWPILMLKNWRVIESDVNSTMYST